MIDRHRHFIRSADSSSPDAVIMHFVSMMEHITTRS